VYSKQSIRTAHFVNLFVTFKNVEFSVFANKKPAEASLIFWYSDD